MLLIENGLVLKGSQLKAEKTNVLIEDGIIAGFPRYTISGADKIDAEGCIVSPSFINSHVHIGDAVALDEGDGKSIDEIVKPPHGIKHKILEESSPENIISAMKESMWDMLYTGTTTFIDYREGGIAGINLLEEASKDIPINKIVLGRDDIFIDPDADLEDVKIRTKKVLKHCDGIAPSGFGEIRDEVAHIIVRECEKQGKFSSIHVAEHEKVQKDSLKTSGFSEIERAVNFKFQLLIHLTHPLHGDLKRVASNGISAVVCPRSNGALNVGIPPLKDMDECGVNTLLGTDNLMFNSPNMFREMEYALKVTRGFYQDYFSPRNILKMATTNASLLGINSGCIKEGMDADIMIMKKKSSNPWLSIINRTESKNIICLMRKGNIIFKR